MGVNVFNRPSYLNWRSANWFSYSDRRLANSVDVVAHVKHAVPDVIGFTTEDGKGHLVKALEGKLDEITELVKANDYAGPLKLESAN
ncbi:hypothetical protein H0H81_001879 [Sphagnurus paluster]|uniref:Uncharacterized protein n=1 Tax=Sphagnurus paluster TaxID=117069 RepID=A0A9P7FMA2_9AGAR|nr:hypothetical protein H0H81_001879 [Sphagnurus paluster]